MQQLSMLASSFSEWWSELFTSETSYEYIGFVEVGFLSLRTIVLGILIGFFIACCASVFNRRVLGDFVRLLIENDVLSRDKAKTLEELGYHKNTFIRSALKSGVSLRRVVKCVEEEDFLSEIEQKRKEYEGEEAPEAPRNAEEAAPVGESDAAQETADASMEGIADESTGSVSEKPVAEQPKRGKKPRFSAPSFKMDLARMHFYIPEDMKYMASVKFEKKGTNALTLVFAFVAFAVLAVVAMIFIPDLLQMLDNMIGIFDWRSNVVT